MKETRIKFLTIGVFTLAMINVVLIIFILMSPKPQPAPPMRGRMNEETRGAHFLMRNLDLSENQKGEFRRLFHQHHQRKDSLDRLIHQKKSKLAQGVIDGTYDSLTIASSIQEIAGLHEQIEKEMVDHFSDINNLCTPEQKKRLSGILEDVRRDR